MYQIIITEIPYGVNKSKLEIENKLNFKFKKNNLLVVYHPETANRKNLIRDFSELLKSLDKFENIQIIFTNANADVDGDIINKMIKNYVKNNKSRACVFSSMGQVNYLSTLKLVDAIIGNSSIKKIYSKKFKNKLLKDKNPYGTSGASFKAFKVLKKIKNRKFNEKTFFDINL